MKLDASWSIVDGKSGKLAVYTARPAAAERPLPGVLVLQEIWGVDEHITDVADRIAAAGYVAVSPDVYSIGDGNRPDAISANRVEAVKAFMDTMPPGSWQDNAAREAALAKLPEADAAAVTESMSALFGQFAHMETFIDELVHLVDWLAAAPYCNGRIGAIGFCMGGGLASRLACESPKLGAAVGFYGAAPTAEQIAHMHCPVLGLHGERDTRLVGQIPDFEQAAAAAGKSYEAIVYPDAEHAFFNDTRSSYRAEAARPAWARTLAFLDQHLGQE